MSVSTRRDAEQRERVDPVQERNGGELEEPAGATEKPSEVFLSRSNPSTSKRIGTE